MTPSQIMPSLFGDVISTFMGVAKATDPKATDAEVVVSGVPFDLACSGRSGTRMGPNAIRQSTANLIWEGRISPWKSVCGCAMRAIWTMPTASRKAW